MQIFKCLSKSKCTEIRFIVANKTVDGLIYYSLTITDIGNNQLTIKMNNFEHRSHGSKSFGIITTDEEPDVKTAQAKN